MRSNASIASKPSEIAIWNAYYGCDPDAKTKACSASAPGASDKLRVLLGRPIQEGSEGYWCAGRLTHGQCRFFASSPRTFKAPPAVVFDRQVYLASFEFGQLHAYLTGKKWRVVALADTAGRRFYSLYLSLTQQLGGNPRLILGTPLGHASKNKQAFGAACCAYAVTFDPVANKYTISGDGGGCTIKARTVAPPRAAAPQLDWKLNGHRVKVHEEQTLRYIAQRVVPPLKRYFGSRKQAVDGAAIVAWWSLKEGIFGTSNPIAFSLCDAPREVLTDKPMSVCSKRAWQVGMGAVQAPRPPGSPSNWFTKPISSYIATYRGVALKCFPGSSADKLLRRTSREAGYPASGSVEQSIVGSKDHVRAAWLLRISAVGFAQQVARVTKECITGTKSWCSGTGWTSTKLYAPNKSAATAVRAKLKTMLDALAPL